MAHVARMKIEGLMKGKKLPFDDQVLEYLLNTAAQAASIDELLELTEDFCPKWQKHERVALTAHLKTMGGKQDGGSDFPSLTPSQPSTSSRAPAAPRGPVATQSDGDQLAADMLLAQMLQEEEDARAALNNPAPTPGTTGKKGKKAFKPLKIDYQVARGGNAGPALGTAAPSSLADVLRQKRSQQVDTGPPTLQPGPGPGQPGPGAPRGPWGPSGLSWAERMQMNNAEPEMLQGEVQPMAAAGGRAMHPLKVRVRSAQAEHHVEAQPADTVGDVKSRLEKMHGISFSLQRLLHGGRELKDNEALKPLSDTQNQIYLQLYMQDAQPRGNANLQIRLQMPGAGAPSPVSVPERITGVKLKEQIQKDHGIRKDHISLTFFGHPLRDDLTISEQGVATGGCIIVSILPSAPLPTSNLAGLQTSAHGRVMDESEAVQAAMDVSRGSTNGTSRSQVNGTGPSSQEMDEDHLGSEDLTMDLGDEEAVGDFNKDVAAQEPRFSVVVNQAKAIASHYRMEDFIGRVSKRSGYRLTLLMQKTKKDKVMGFLVFRFRERSLHVLQVAVAKDARGRGAGRAMLRWAAQQAQRSNMENVVVSAWPFRPELFTKLGFTRTTNGNFAEANGQVLELQVAKSKGSKRSANDGSQEVRLNRKDLIRAVFEALNRSGSGCLIAAEMKPFAESTGFDGSDEEWQKEFEMVIKDCGSTHISLKEFDRLVNDQSESGCYCSDEELRALLQKLPPPSTSKGRVPQPPTGSGRSDMIKSAFTALNRSGSGHLSAAEMKPFAEKTGFSGTDAEWQEEFNLLKKECGLSVIALKDFDRLVNDQSESGCYCSDADLRELLESLPSIMPSGHQRESELASTAGVRGSNVPQGGDVRPGRSELIKSAFHVLNQSGSGHLSAAEMKPFAEHTGFQGTEAEWQAEFDVFKKEWGLSQIALKDFDRLVNDESDSGCYCSDADLRSLLESLPSVSISPVQTRPRQPSVTVDTSPVANGPLEPRSKAAPAVPNGHGASDATTIPSRDHLITAAFNALNRSGSGNLSAAEMKPFAEKTGFTGTDAEWLSEYDMLRQECRVQPAVSLTDFRRLVNDQSEAGCYCSDADLKLLLEVDPHPPSRPEPPSGVLEPAAKSKPVPQASNQDRVQESRQGSGRAELIKAAFRALNVSGSGYLSAAEMKPFAEATGFSGSDREWQEEFDLLRKDCSASPMGISFKDFEHLANDESEDGCYCEDSQLRVLVDARPKPAAATATTTNTARAYASNQDRVQESRQGSGRAELIKAAFRALNVSGSGYLSAAEMKPFAEATGFSGSDREWQEEFDLLRKDCSASPMGISFKDFEHLANDESEDGCYCEDSQLRVLVDARPKPAAATATTTNPASATKSASTDASGKRSHGYDAPARANGAAHGGGIAEAQSNGHAQSRGQLIEAVFYALNRSGTGNLSQKEMRPFAEFTGFDGTHEEWLEEFNLLRRQCSGQVGLKEFYHLVNDETEDGCYASDDELRKLLAHVVPPARPDSRTVLVQSVFQALNRSGSGRLTAAEMRPFAEHTGFDGTDQEWQHEFDKLRRECKGGMVGFNDFNRLVNDESDAGAYTSDQDLQAFLDFLRRPVGVPAFRPPPGLHPPTW